MLQDRTPDRGKRTSISFPAIIISFDLGKRVLADVPSQDDSLLMRWRLSGTIRRLIAVFPSDSRDILAEQ